MNHGWEVGVQRRRSLARTGQQRSTLTPNQSKRHIEGEPENESAERATTLMECWRTTLTSSPPQKVSPNSARDPGKQKEKDKPRADRDTDREEERESKREEEEQETGREAGEQREKEGTTREKQIS